MEIRKTGDYPHIEQIHKTFLFIFIDIDEDQVELKLIS